MTATVHSSYTPDRGLKVVDFVCRKMEKQMKHDISLGGSWFKLFKRYDRDSSGMVDFGEMEHVLRKEVKIRKTEISDDELALLWATFDADGSGHVTIKEFSGFMRRYAKFGKSAFNGKIPITPMSNVGQLSERIMEAGRSMMVEEGMLNINDISAHFRGSEYEQFSFWLVSNREKYDQDGNGKFEIGELQTALNDFILEMERDRARLQASKSVTTLPAANMTQNTNGTTNTMGGSMGGGGIRPKG